MLRALLELLRSGTYPHSASIVHLASTPSHGGQVSPVKGYRDGY
jgi:hypothetical protein